MTNNNLTTDEKRRVEQARLAFDEAKKADSLLPSERFIDKCSIESGAMPVEDEESQVTDTTSSGVREIVRKLLKRLST